MYSFFVQFVISYKLLSFSKYLKTFNVEIVVSRKKRFQDEPIQKRWKINKLAKLEDAVAEKAKQKLENLRPLAASDYRLQILHLGGKVDDSLILLTF